MEEGDKTNSNEYTYDCLDLDTEGDFSIMDDDDEENECAAFFSAEPDDIRDMKALSEEVEALETVRRERKWTVYDLTSAKFLPVRKISQFTSELYIFIKRK